jgi:hypothetical protein
MSITAHPTTSGFGLQCRLSPATNIRRNYVRTVPLSSTCGAATQTGGACRPSRERGPAPPRYPAAIAMRGRPLIMDGPWMLMRARRDREQGQGAIAQASVRPIAGSIARQRVSQDGAAISFGHSPSLRIRWLSHAKQMQPPETQGSF